MILKWGDNEARIGLQELRKDIFAKVEELQNVARGIATSTAHSIASENRFAREDHVVQMLNRRDQLAAFLRETGVAENRIAEVVQPITLMADWDLRVRILADAGWKLKPQDDPTDPAPRDAAMAELRATLQRAERLQALDDAERLIKGKYADRMDPDKVSKHFKQYRELPAAGRLPKTGPTTDLSHAPMP